MTKTPKATAANVSRVLGKRHTRSTSYRSMVRGLPTHSPGFAVRAYGKGALVEHYTGSYASRSTEAQLAALEKYAATLNAAGFHTEVHANAFAIGTALIVTNTPEENA